jgi:two-component system sensor histidine kinase UhpB
MQEQIDTTIKKVQHIASELRPALLDTLGLSAAVEWYVREFNMRTHIDVKLQKCEEIKFPDMTKPTMLFRILQEALTNVARHSGATRVEVELRRNNGMIELRVQDNGRGITKEEQVRSTSVGVLGMIERAHTIGGSMSITGGKGTEVRVVVPMEQASTQRMETE